MIFILSTKLIIVKSELYAKEISNYMDNFE